MSIESRLMQRLEREYRRRRKTIESCVRPSTQFVVPRDERDPLPGTDGAVEPGRAALLRLLLRVHDPSPAEDSSGES